MAALGITGVVVVARPPGLFPPEVIITILIIFKINNSINIIISLSSSTLSLSLRRVEISQKNVTIYFHFFRFQSTPWSPTSAASTGPRANLQSKTSRGSSGPWPRPSSQPPSTSSPDRWKTTLLNLFGGSFNVYYIPGKARALFGFCLLVRPQRTCRLHLRAQLGYARSLPGTLVFCFKSGLPALKPNQRQSKFQSECIWMIFHNRMFGLPPF